MILYPVCTFVGMTADLPGNSQPFSSNENLQLGIGTLWTLNELLEEDECTYKLNTIASAEYEALSGCAAAIPLETTGGPGTACAHWDELCLKGELMTGFATGGLEISRMTVGSLEDIGYEVDYSQADAFPVENLDPSCVCAAATVEKKAGFKLGGNSIISSSAGANQPTPATKDTRTGFKLRNSPIVTRTQVRGPGGRKLSKEGEENARKYGCEKLRERKRRSKGINKKLIRVGQMMYIGDTFISVLFREGKDIFAVDLWGCDDL
jgi:hypothetical protein